MRPMDLLAGQRVSSGLVVLGSQQSYPKGQRAGRQVLERALAVWVALVQVKAFGPAFLGRAAWALLVVLDFGALVVDLLAA